MSSIAPRSEYPRPQMARQDWLNLNGDWDFEFDFGDTGRERGMAGVDAPYSRKITVPFCPESELSGVHYTDFIESCWYRRKFARPKSWRGRDVLLHFQAVDYEATVWVDGEEVGRHRGGFTPFTCCLPDAEEYTVTVRARDPRHMTKPCGKQMFFQYTNGGCSYTRTTGIWQTVWAEPVNKVCFSRPRITPLVDSGSFEFEFPLRNGNFAHGMEIAVRMNGQTVKTTVGCDFTPRLTVKLAKPRLWTLDDPFLYDIELTLTAPGGKVLDVVYCYAGLRAIAFDGKKVLLNGKPVFQRLVLDQGYYPDGIMTAPSDQALIDDILLSKAAGFNGARLHQKVFEERFLYHADRLGYLVWSEFGDWGMVWRCLGGGMVPENPEYNQVFAALLAQWSEALERDYNHPAIVGWCPLNETAWFRDDLHPALCDLTEAAYRYTKLYDRSRPVLDVSGFSHFVAGADVYDSHNYTQEPEKFSAELAPIADDRPFTNSSPSINSVKYAGQPYFCSEFGGIKWNPKQHENSTESWGYGDAPKTLNEFYERFAGLCRVQLENPHLFGYCYTQLTDVFQEQNGIYNFDRTPKFDLTAVRAAQTIPAAIEKAE